MLRLPRTKWSSLLPWKSKLFYHLSIKYIVCVETFPNLALNIASLNLGNYFAGVWCIFSQKASYYRPWDFLLTFEQALQRVAAKVNEVLSFIRAAFFFTPVTMFFLHFRYCIKAKKKPSTNDNIDMTDFYDDDYDLDDDDDYGDEDEEAAEDTDDSGNGN